jgi:hypothetical protein
MKKIMINLEETIRKIRTLKKTNESYEEGLRRFKEYNERISEDKERKEKVLDILKQIENEEVENNRKIEEVENRVKEDFEEELVDKDYAEELEKMIKD